MLVLELVIKKGKWKNEASKALDFSTWHNCDFAMTVWNVNDESGACWYCAQKHAHLLIANHCFLAIDYYMQAKRTLCTTICFHNGISKESRRDL